MLFVDSHVHLPAYADPRAVIREAQVRQTRLFSVSTSPGDASMSLNLMHESPTVVKAFVGVHPSEALSIRDLGTLRGQWGSADGIGEIGLDPKYSEVSENSVQMSLFKEQLSASEDHKKPVQVHSRKAEKECLDVLASYRPASVLLHWFEGEELLGRAVGAGYYVSFGPALLYSKKLARMAARCPLDRILSESDGPVPYSPLGRAEGPGLIPSVIFKLAELLGKGFDEMAQQLSSNAERYCR